VVLPDDRSGRCSGVPDLPCNLNLSSESLGVAFVCLDVEAEIRRPSWLSSAERALSFYLILRTGMPMIAHWPTDLCV